MSVDDLRDELKRLGYLSHGMERWFALDPWKSRTFWSELLIVAAKAATLSAVFVALPMIVVMLLRNRPLGVLETVVLSAVYVGGSFLAVMGLMLLSALVIKIRPSVPIRSPRGLTIFAMFVSGILLAAEALWWGGFPDVSSIFETIVALALFVTVFVTMSVVSSAALLSFSIHESHQIPSSRRRSLRVPLMAGSGLVLALLFALPFLGAGENDSIAAPPQVAVTPSHRRLALVAVDGLSIELFSGRPGLRGSFAATRPIEPFVYRSSPEVWATVGTGTAPAAHRVHAVDGIVLAGSSHVVQSISDRDFLLRGVAPAFRIVRAQPLPPTARQRSYVWEIFADRGITCESVNWWTSAPSGIALTSVTQEEVFGAAAAQRSSGPVEMAQRIDAIALARFLRLLKAEPRFATVYLPAIDIVLNRVESDSATQLSASMQELDRIATLSGELRRLGYDVILIGLPGSGQRGRGVIATTFPLSGSVVHLEDVGPTVLDLFGFPASEEMHGRSLVGSAQPRIPSYGVRERPTRAGRVDEEYYETLRSLGYIR